MARADKQRNIDKVAASLVKNPLQTEHEIAKDTGLWHGTVHRAKKEVGKIGEKDPRIVNLTNWDFDIMEAIQRQKKERLADTDSKVSNRDIDTRANTATKRYSLFRGNATDEEGGLKVDIISYKEE